MRKRHAVAIAGCIVAATTCVSGCAVVFNSATQPQVRSASGVTAADSDQTVRGAWGDGRVKVSLDRVIATPYSDFSGGRGETAGENARLRFTVNVAPDVELPNGELIVTIAAPNGSERTADSVRLRPQTRGVDEVIWRSVRLEGEHANSYQAGIAQVGYSRQ